MEIGIFTYIKTQQRLKLNDDFVELVEPVELFCASAFEEKNLAVYIIWIAKYTILQFHILSILFIYVGKNWISSIVDFVINHLK